MLGSQQWERFPLRVHRPLLLQHSWTRSSGPLEGFEPSLCPARLSSAHPKPILHTKAVTSSEVL